MGKRKIFVRTDLTIPHVIDTPEEGGKIVLAPALPPAIREVSFGRNTTKALKFDFAPWYGVGINGITLALQRQVERFLAKQDADVEVTTVVGYCKQGIARFLTHLTMLSEAEQRVLQLSDLRRSVIERGDEAMFPRNPFAGSTREGKGQRPLSSNEKKAFSLAIRAAVQPLFREQAEPTSTLAAYALLIVALHTGRNTTPLLEMSTDCLRAHPKDGLEFLVVYKRRGHTSSRISLRSDSSVRRIVESTPTLRVSVALLVRRFLILTSSLRPEAPGELRDRVWLYRRSRDGQGQVSALTTGTLEEAIKKLVRSFDLRGDDGLPMKINVSRLRKTFVNRVYEILDGDIVGTAIAAGNTAAVTARSYLRPSEDSRKNWRFMGLVLVEELRTNTLGATERTPVGRCSDSTDGEYAPKGGGKICQSFLNCLRCRNYVVTGDDLWRLFSFYWRILRERPRVDRRQWDRQLAHIPRLIDRDVIEIGLRRKMFRPEQVYAARQRARHDPHPFWASPSIMNDLNSLA